MDPARQQFIAYMAGECKLTTLVKTLTENQMLIRRQNRYIQERNASGSVNIENIIFQIHSKIIILKKAKKKQQ